jgi:hypothetical protein
MLTITSFPIDRITELNMWHQVLALVAHLSAVCFLLLPAWVGGQEQSHATIVEQTRGGTGLEAD